MTKELQIADAKLEDDGKKLWIEVDVVNPTNRTLHFYRTMRAIRYDPASRVLQVQLSDRNLEEPHATDTFIHPRIIAVDPGGRARFRLPLPRRITRVQPGGQNLRTPVIEALPAYEAEEVEVEIAWSGTPFYRDPRPTGKGPRADLTAWAQGFATTRVRRHRAGPEQST